MKEKIYNVIVILDLIEDGLISQSLELVAFAESFASGNLSNTLVIVPGKDVFTLSNSVSEKFGLDTLAIEHDELYYPNPELMVQVIAGIISENNPEAVIFTHTVRNCQITAKLSVIMKASSVTAVESVLTDGNEFIFKRSIFNGKLKENIRLKSLCKVITVLPGAYTLTENKINLNSNAKSIQKKISYNPQGYKVTGISSEAETGVKLDDADVIVSAGRGIGKVENLELIRETAVIFPNSAVGASRPVCDQRWLPFSQQVGITGKTVSPKLYIACGISGSQQHIAGMKNSQCIVAINIDPNASIFSIADYIIIEDIINFLTVLLRKYGEKFIK